MEYTYDHTFLWFPRCRAWSSAYSWELGADCWRVIFTCLVNWLVGGQLISGTYQISTPLWNKSKKPKLRTNMFWWMLKIILLIYPFLKRKYYLFSQKSERSLKQQKIAFLQKVNNSIATKLCVKFMNKCTIFWIKKTHVTIQWLNCVILFLYENKLKIDWEN